VLLTGPTLDRARVAAAAGRGRTLRSHAPGLDVPVDSYGVGSSLIRGSNTSPPNRRTDDKLSAKSAAGSGRPTVSSSSAKTGGARGRDI